MRLIDADDLYQKCIEIQLKKRNRYFDIDDVIKLIKKAPTVDVLDKIKAEFINRYPKNYAGELDLGGSACHFSLNEILEIIDKYRNEVSK